MNERLIWRVVATILAGFLTAILIRECRDIRNTRDAVIRIEAQQKK
jgi:hypothetical protein